VKLTYTLEAGQQTRGAAARQGLADIVSSILFMCARCGLLPSKHAAHELCLEFRANAPLT